jgi:hypothetical protein
VARGYWIRQNLLLPQQIEKKKILVAEPGVLGYYQMHMV